MSLALRQAPSLVGGRGVGPSDARVMIVGEAWGETEEERGEPFVGMSGKELTEMLAQAGIDRSQCFITNVVNARPPGNKIELWWTEKKKKSREQGCFHFRDGYFYNDIIAEGLLALEHDIARIRPNVIIALGNVPMWALIGETGIMSWRGSVAWSERYKVKVCPTLHPALVLRMFEWKTFVLTDLERFQKEIAFPDYRVPEYQFETRPTYEAVCRRIDWLMQIAESNPLELAIDIETRTGHIACLGIAWTHLDAMCIPFMCVENPLGYWPQEQEFEIVRRLRQLLLHPNVRAIGQNFLYDAQYLARHWGFVPEVAMDTMIWHHVHWLGTRKSLDFLSSLYCKFHCFWKDDGKEWEKDLDENRLWVYNCRDAVATFEVAQRLKEQNETLGMVEQTAFMQSLFKPVLRMMLRGVRWDEALGTSLTLDLLGFISEREASIFNMTGLQLNPNSPKQLIQYFYHYLNLPKQWRIRRNGRSLSTDDEALEALAKAEPLVRKLCYCIREIRSLRNSVSVINRKRDNDRRVRCSYNIAGTESTRFSSSENAFGNGMNLQNITAGGESEETGLVLPNLRRLFLPDPGCVIVDIDLARADAQVVAWEADDPILKQIFRENVDLHWANAKMIWGDGATKYHRQLAKIFCHAANYGAMPRKLSKALGLLMVDAERAWKRWFEAHPWILEWHRRVQNELYTTRQVRNAFGFRRFYFERIEDCFTEALAWVPQSTVAEVINHILKRLDPLPCFELLLQVHDSLTFQMQRHTYQQDLAKHRDLFRVVVPYKDPLVIPVGFKVSEDSWGDVEELRSLA